MRTNVVSVVLVGTAVAVTALFGFIIPRGEPGQWQQAIPILTRTAVSSSVAGLAAALAGAVFALAYRTGGTLVWLIGLGACIPLVFPPVALATALINEPFTMDPYGTSVIVVAQAISCLPVTFLIQAGSLAMVSDDLIMASASLGVRSGATLKRIFRGPWVRSFWTSMAVATLVIASDPSVTLVFGGTDSYIASHVFRAMRTGMGGNVGLVLIVLLVPALLLAIYLTSAWTNWTLIRDSFRKRNPQFVAHYFTWRHRLHILTVPIAVVLVAITAIIVAGAPGMSADEVISGTTVVTTSAVLVFTIPAALVCGLVTAVLARRHQTIGFVIHTLLILTFLMSQTAIGMILSAFFRVSMSVGSVTVLPSLVGGSALAGGYVAVAISYLSVAVPIAHVGITMMISTVDELIDAAKDAGADSVRAAATVIPVLRPHIVTLVGVMSGIILTRTAPVIFIQPPGFETASTSLTTFAAAGWDDKVFLVSLVTAAVAGGAFLLAFGSRLMSRSRGVL